MKYCQKCKVMLKDEVEVCPICGAGQMPQEEFEAKEQKKKKTRKTVLIVIAAVLAVLLIAYAVVMILGKPVKAEAKDEVFAEDVTDEELLAEFGSYTGLVLPQIWDETEEGVQDAIEYYNESYPGVSAGFEQMTELRPVAGEVSSVTFEDAAKSEEGGYRMVGDLICENGKVAYVIELNSSGYVVNLILTPKEETFLQKAREKVLDIQSKIQ